MAETWDESKPAGSRSPTLGDDDIREFKRAMRERLAEDHIFESTENPAFGAGGGYDIGKHKFITLVQRNTSKVTASDEVAMVCKEVSGNPELLLTPPSAGTDRQLTKNSGANFNLNSSDFDTAIIPSSGIIADAINSSHIAADQVNSSHIAANQVNSSHIPDYTINSDQLNSGSLTGEKWEQESAGDNYYFGNHGGDAWGGRLYSTTSGSYVEKALLRIVTGGTFRFRLGALNDTNDQYALVRLKKNGGVVASHSMRGTAGSDSMTYNSADVAASAGDYFTFEIRLSGGGTAHGRVYVRGTNCTALLHAGGAAS